MNADSIRIESDEHGFELHIETDEGDRYIFNIHDVAEDLFDACVKRIGPWILERDQAKAEYDSGRAGDPTQQAVLDRVKSGDPYADLEDGPWPGESVQAFYERTGQDGPLREVADAMNKARKEA